MFYLSIEWLPKLERSSTMLDNIENKKKRMGKLFQGGKNLQKIRQVNHRTWSDL